MDERRQLLKKCFDELLTEMRQKKYEWESALTKSLDGANDSKTLGAGVGSFINQLIKGIPGETKRVIERSVHEGIDSRLDEIQRQLGQLCGTQEKLEQIQDKLAELTAANQERAQLGEVPPMPVVDETSPSKKEYTVDRERLTGTVDSVLFELFHEERRARGVTVSRMLDIALWQRYDKPRLSFEIKLDGAPFSRSKETKADQGKRKRGRPRKKQK
ncbi:MAG: hypothetical protein ACLP5H_01530 [Desulfomonilaceae bacterium]